MATMSAATTTTNNNSKMAAADTKILADLGTVKEKMDLCYALMNPGEGKPKPSIKSSEAVLAVVGFLEACAPRMVELVEVTASGALVSESVFEECLIVNDQLQKQLADIETAALTETSASTTAASAATPPPAPAAAASTSSSVEQQFEDLLLGDDDDNKPPATKTDTTIPTGKSTGDEDEDDGADDTKQQQQSSDDVPITQTSSNDEFDNFFAERTGNNNS